MNEGETIFSKVDGMTDITAPRLVQVQVSEDGRLWVNVDGICVLRCCRAGSIEIERESVTICRIEVDPPSV